MEYKELRKLYYGDRETYKQVYESRIHSPNACLLDFEVAGKQAFFVQSNEVVQLMYSLLRLDKEIGLLCDVLPNAAMNQYSKKCLIDEIVLTNNIEGVHSSRKEIGEVLTTLEEQSERKGKQEKFLGLVNKYLKLRREENVDLYTCQDIRAIYDEIVLPEVAAENTDMIPDGTVFRKDQTVIQSVTGKVIHTGMTPESKVVGAMEKALAFLHDDSIDALYRACLFHYMLEYIHPFYDGNGRLGRFILSYGISKELSSLLAYRISEAVKENITDYYNAFTVCNDPHNLGDLTPFLIKMLMILEGAATELRDSLRRKSISWDRYETVSKALTDGQTKKMRAVYSLLIQGALFGEQGISRKDLLSVLSISASTLNKRLSVVHDQKLLVCISEGQQKFYKMDLNVLDDMFLKD